MKLEKVKKILLKIIQVVFIMLLFPVGIGFISIFSPFASSAHLLNPGFQLLLGVGAILFVILNLCLIALIIVCWKQEQKDTDNTESTPGNIMTLEDEKNN